MSCISEADFHLQVLSRLRIVEIKVDVVNHLVQVVKINCRVRFRELELLAMAQAEFVGTRIVRIEGDTIGKVNRVVIRGTEIVHVEHERFQQQRRKRHHNNARKRMLYLALMGFNKVDAINCNVFNRLHNPLFYKNTAQGGCSHSPFRVVSQKDLRIKNPCIKRCRDYKAGNYRPSSEVIASKTTCGSRSPSISFSRPQPR